jgi:hypothetical protein
MSKRRLAAADRGDDDGDELPLDDELPQPARPQPAKRRATGNGAYGPALGGRRAPRKAAASPYPACVVRDKHEGMRACLSAKLTRLRGATDSTWSAAGTCSAAGAYAVPDDGSDSDTDDDVEATAAIAEAEREHSALVKKIDAAGGKVVSRSMAGLRAELKRRAACRSRTMKRTPRRRAACGTAFAGLLL